MPSKKSKKSNQKMSEEQRQRILAQYNTVNTVIKPTPEEEIVVPKSDVNVKEDLKSPVVSFMGHVDAGKTFFDGCNSWY